MQALLWREGGGEVRVEILTVEMRVGVCKGEESDTCVRGQGDAEVEAEMDVSILE